MGDTWGDGFNMEKPTHQVELTYGFFVGKHPVTFNEYNEFCVDKGAVIPSDEGWGMGSRPVINVPWWMAIEYCNWLSEKDGLPPAYIRHCEVNEGQLLDSEGKLTTDITEVLGYRLLTEAEWEYVARGGKHNSEYKWSGSDNPSLVAWYDYNSNDKTHPVGQLEPNALGVYDMSGTYSSGAPTSTLNIPLLKKQIRTFPAELTGFVEAVAGPSPKRISVYLIGLLPFPRISQA
nr:SUMF1/EgtB/PvdO family nonheme iron enzyme [Mesotoga sp. B105.6.4]